MVGGACAGMLVVAGMLALMLGLPDVTWGQGLRHFREAREAYHSRDLDGAIRHYTLAIESRDLPHPELFFALNNRGIAHAAKRDYERALHDFSEALRLNPKYAGARRNRGIVYAQQRDYERAIEDYSEAARLDPDDPHALIGRGFVYCEQQQFDRAVQDFDAALGICPTCPRAISGRAAAAVAKDCR